MIFSTYVFYHDRLNDRLYQYPLDNTRQLFRHVADSVPRSQHQNTTLVIRRDGDIVYYIYLRRLAYHGCHTLGLCVVSNGVLFENIHDVIRSFEGTCRQVYEDDLDNDIFVGTDMNSRLIINNAADNALDGRRTRIFSYFMKGWFNSIKVTPALPQQSYAVSKDNCRVFELDKELPAIKNSYGVDGFVYIKKWGSYSLDSYRQTIEAFWELSYRKCHNYDDFYRYCTCRVYRQGPCKNIFYEKAKSCLALLEPDRPVLKPRPGIREMISCYFKKVKKILEGIGLVKLKRQKISRKRKRQKDSMGRYWRKLYGVPQDRHVSKAHLQQTHNRRCYHRR